MFGLLLFLLAGSLKFGEALIDVECKTGAVTCNIVRPHFLYSDHSTISASTSLHFNNALHCTQHLCRIDIQAPLVIVDANATLTGSEINILGDTVIIEGIINSDGRGHVSDQGVGPGSPPIASLWGGAIGGGYNGPGRTRCHGSSFGSSLQFGDGEYGDAEESLATFQHHHGSGGGRGITENVRGGNGGGIVNVTARYLLVINGRITANANPGYKGVDGSCNGGGGGAGGSIWLTSPMANGTGQILAMGGKGGMAFDTRVSPGWTQGCNGALYGTPGGNGEGGRIVLITPTIHHAYLMSVRGGEQNEWTCVDGGTGQIFYSATRYLNPPYYALND